MAAEKITKFYYLGIFHAKRLLQCLHMRQFYNSATKINIKDF